MSDVLLDSPTIELDVELEEEISQTSVVPNPEGEPTETLEKIGISGVNYKIKDPGVPDWARAETVPTYTKSDVGLGNVDNTSDLNKPISTATQEALGNKLDKAATAETAYSLLTVSTIDKAPYVYRQAPAPNSFVVNMKKIIGGSVVWNQLVDSNTTSITIPSGNIYFAKINGVKSVETSDGVAISVLGNRLDNVTDLTVMFKSTIADYVLSLETQTVGSGIKWLQSYGFFTADNYPYAPIKLESSCIFEKKIYGANLINANLKGSGTDYNDITLKIGTYTVSCVETLDTTKNWYLRFKKKDGTFISDKNIVGLSNYNYSSSSNWFYGGAISQTVTFSIPFDEVQVLFFRQNEDNTKKLMLNYGEYAKSYVSYQNPTTHSIDPTELRGLFALTEGKLTVSGDIYNADGIIQRNFEQRTYQSGDESLANAITDGTNTIIQLVTPISEQSIPFVEKQTVFDVEELVDYEVAQGNRDVAIPVGTDTDYYQEVVIPPLPTTSGNHTFGFNPSSGFYWS